MSFSRLLFSVITIATILTKIEMAFRVFEIISAIGFLLSKSQPFTATVLT
jgi:hypothetical protein